MGGTASKEETIIRTDEKYLSQTFEVPFKNNDVQLELDSKPHIISIFVKCYNGKQYPRTSILSFIRPTIQEFRTLSMDSSLFFYKQETKESNESSYHIKFSSKPLADPNHKFEAGTFYLMIFYRNIKD